VKCGIGTVDWYYVNWSCRPIYRLLLSRFKRFLLTFWFISPDILVDSPDVLVNFPRVLISWSTYWLTRPWCESIRPFKSNVRKQCLLKKYWVAFHKRRLVWKWHAASVLWLWDWYQWLDVYFWNKSMLKTALPSLAAKRGCCLKNSSDTR